MKFPALTSNLGLKLLALALAIVTYHALKSDHPALKAVSERSPSVNTNEYRIFHWN